MPRFYETTLSITNLHNLSISTHVNRSRIDSSKIKTKTPNPKKVKTAKYSIDAIAGYWWIENYCRSE